MRKIVDYKILKYSDITGFKQTEIVRLIENGWQPWGSPIVIIDDVFQAMVKYEEG